MNTDNLWRAHYCSGGFELNISDIAVALIRQGIAAKSLKSEEDMIEIFMYRLLSWSWDSMHDAEKSMREPILEIELSPDKTLIFVSKKTIMDGFGGYRQFIMGLTRYWWNLFGDYRENPGIGVIFTSNKKEYKEFKAVLETAVPQPSQYTLYEYGQAPKGETLQ
jgi:hypothetical protein